MLAIGEPGRSPPPHHIPPSLPASFGSRPQASSKTTASGSSRCSSSTRTRWCCRCCRRPPPAPPAAAACSCSWAVFALGVLCLVGFKHTQQSAYALRLAPSFISLDYSPRRRRLWHRLWCRVYPDNTVYLTPAGAGAAGGGRQRVQDDRAGAGAAGHAGGSRQCGQAPGVHRRWGWGCGAGRCAAGGSGWAGGRQPVRCLALAWACWPGVQPSPARPAADQRRAARGMPSGPANRPAVAARQRPRHPGVGSPWGWLWGRAALWALETPV